MPIHISPIAAADFDALYHIEQATHAIPWSIGTLKNCQGDHYLNLKAVKNGNIVGFLICQTVLDEATLFNIAVHPDYQGNGIGRALLTALTAQLTAQHIQTLWLEVRESNRPALHLYQSLGFNHVDLRKNYYPTPDGKWEHAVVMACYLGL